MRIAATRHRHFSTATLAAALLLILNGCGGGGGGESTPITPPVTIAPTAPSPVLPATRLSADSLIAAGCTGGATSGLLYRNAEVEPSAAVHPGNAKVLLAAWQQDRWSSSGALATVTAVSLDGGATWARRLMPFSRCGGAALGSAGDFERASDPWVDIGPTGVMFAMSVAFNRASAGSAVVVSRSTDNGQTWGATTAVQNDTDGSFNDKATLTADATDARYVYAVWNKLDSQGAAPTLLARSSDGGAQWAHSRAIYTPTVNGGISQTIGNRIVVLPDGTLVNSFTTIDTVGQQSTAWLGVIRSRDKGLSWSAPIRIATMQGTGSFAPQTGKAIRDSVPFGFIAASASGRLWLTWQDARFSGGKRDAIAVSHSDDGGISWSTPIAINSRTDVAAFTPSIAVNADGTVGVSYYDLRADTSDASTLLTSAWLATSRDGVSWSETNIWNPFDLNHAPDAGGLFLGDYASLLSVGGNFMPVLAVSSLDDNNRTDIFTRGITPPASAADTPAVVKKARATLSADAELTLSQASHQAIQRALARRSGSGFR